ncbi:MAG: GNAT family N-acetyltransferase [Candidatus Cloacimonetes bacterium]|nr:GNAT family N-acetyltransferase [Candidatus Cloacimonadota bacterium]
MYNIINVWEYQSGMDAAISYIHAKWGNKENLNFYHDAIIHSSKAGDSLPQFYLILEGERVAGCYALLVNDLISRHDLLPWLGCLFVEPEYRGKKMGSKMLEHGLVMAGRMGFAKAYLTTDHDGYYEKYGWIRMEDGYNFQGEQGRIFWHTT